jgi:hypothetical protein
MELSRERQKRNKMNLIEILDESVCNKSQYNAVRPQKDTWIQITGEILRSGYQILTIILHNEIDRE